MIWDVALFKRLQHGDSRFEVDVRFATDAFRLALYGPSGSGKSQTLKMIAGIAHPDHGHVRINGRTAFASDTGVDLSPQERRLAYVFQDYALFPHLTVRQNIAFAKSRGLLNPNRHATDDEVDRWIEAFHLSSIVDHYPHQISGGQRQRTALARALVIEPTALLLDEPFAALDKSLRVRMRGELAELQAQIRIPMLLITHDDDDVHMLADEVVHIHAGQVVTASEARQALA